MLIWRRSVVLKRMLIRPSTMEPPIQMLALFGDDLLSKYSFYRRRPKCNRQSNDEKKNEKKSFNDVVNSAVCDVAKMRRADKKMLRRNIFTKKKSNGFCFILSSSSMCGAQVYILTPIPFDSTASIHFPV